MANPEHLSRTSDSSQRWNDWRKQNPTLRPDLSKGELSMAIAREGAVNQALLRHGLGGGIRDFSGFDLHDADLREANLSGQIFTGATLDGADLRGADLRGADLTHAHFVNVSLRGAKLNNCRVFGISTWNVDLTGAEQSNLIINPEKEGNITVDYLEVAQFIYLLLNNAKIRDVIDTLTAKAVLILGRFTPERKTVLNAIQQVLRSKGYLPILFDFQKPTSRDFTETVSTLAHMSRFIIADITDARGVPQELSHIIPHLPSVTIAPILHDQGDEYVMFEHWMRYNWVLKTYRYNGEQEIIKDLEEKVIGPCERQSLAIRKRL